MIIQFRPQLWLLLKKKLTTVYSELLKLKQNKYPHVLTILIIAIIDFENISMYYRFDSNKAKKG